MSERLKRGYVCFLSFMLGLFTLVPAAFAESPIQITSVYDDFSDLSDFTLNNFTPLLNPNKQGVDVAGHKVLRLTTTAMGMSGSAFQTQRVHLENDRSFSTYFTFQIQPDQYNYGADGLVFVIQTNSDQSFSGGGYMIGYDGIRPSIGIEFDTYNNGYPLDSSRNHVGLDVNGSVQSLQTVDLADDLQSGIWHIWIDYNGLTDRLEVRTSKDSDVRPTNAVLTYNIDLQSTIDMDDVFVGFTSGTGAGYANHDIRSFYFNNDYSPIDVRDQTYVAAPAHVQLNSDSHLSNGTCQITATVTDKQGLPAANQTVTFHTSLGDITPTSLTDASGHATALLRTTVPGQAIVRASVIGGHYGETSVVFDTVRDTLAPVTDALFDPLLPSGMNGWYNSNVTLSLNAADDAAGSGVKTILYRINNGQWNTYSGPVSLIDDGQYQIEYYSTDMADNDEVIKSTNAKLDKTAPETVASGVTNGQWYNSDVSIFLTATDNLSGVSQTQYRIDQGEWQQYVSDILLSADGKHDVDYRSQDVAGNWGEMKSLEVNIDKSIPTLTVIPSQIVIEEHNHKLVPITMLVTANDHLSGLDKVLLTSITSNEPDKDFFGGDKPDDIQFADIGTYDEFFSLRAERWNNGNGRIYTITYTATDKAGNIATKASTVTVPIKKTSNNR